MLWMLMVLLTFCCNVFAVETPASQTHELLIEGTQEDVDGGYDDDDVDDEATEEMYEE